MLPQNDLLLLNGQASDLLSGFSSSVLQILQDLSDTFAEIARNRDNEDFQNVNGDAMARTNKLKQKAAQKIQKEFQDFAQDLAGLAEVSVDKISSAAPSTSEEVNRLKEFYQTGRLVLESAMKVIEGKSNEFVIHLMNSNQAETVKFNMRCWLLKWMLFGIEALALDINICI